MIEKYVKRPVIIEAVQWTGKNVEEIARFLNKDKFAILKPIGKLPGYKIAINTLEGVHNVSIGDYIVKGIKGEFYPCKPDIFEQTYERVN